MAAKVPPMEWAQRKDGVFLTIKVPDLTDEKVELTATNLKFSGGQYAFDLAFFASVVPEESKWKNHGRNVQMHVVKASHESWPRLFAEKVAVTTDWSRYVDSDDDDDQAFDMSALDGAENFSGFTGEPGDDVDSDDDVDLSDLDPQAASPV